MKKKYSKIMTVMITFVSLFLLLTCCMIDHNGQADSITPDEIIGAYEIATIHNGHPSYFLSGWEDDNERKIG
jgi:hypothetical protein